MGERKLELELKRSGIGVWIFLSVFSVALATCQAHREHLDHEWRMAEAAFCPLGDQP